MMIIMEYTRDNMAELLRSHHITPTHQRIEIAHALFSLQEHLSADQVMAVVNTRYSETSKATVYNTLKLFLEKGMVREIIADPTKIFFDPNTHPHHHLYDVDTGKLSDISDEHMQVSGLPPLPEGMVIEGIELVVRVRRKT
ncbi:MAG: Fur family transcriptional regulator, iron response regulator [Pseudomonadota bacterium]|nr:Fur family transcriptional regulator, iron response regulator [Pseudomonadota bacterium]